MAGTIAELDWVVLTTGNRPVQLRAAVASLLDDAGVTVRVTVVSNGAGPLDLPDRDGLAVVVAADNLGVPGGRDLGLRHTTAPVVGFLDDDAVAAPGASRRIIDEFSRRPDLGAVSLRLVDEHGGTARRHVPRPRGTGPAASGDVAVFLGGASAIRREAYDGAGGYFVELFYGHEEVELSWRLVERAWAICYLADVEVEHPRTEISRHAEGWRLTGRNRVWIARRTLPWPVALVHTGVWLVVGAMRAPGRDLRRTYLGGWWSGWRQPVERRPIRWSTVWRLTRLGRPPIV